MLRILIGGLVIAVILLIFGAKDAAHTVINGTLTLAKWIFIVGAVIFVGVMVFSNKK